MTHTQLRAIIDAATEATLAWGNAGGGSGKLWEQAEIAKQVYEMKFPSTKAAELLDKIEELEKILQKVEVTMNHAITFILSREKMHPTGVELYKEDLAEVRAALANKQEKTT